ncbi:acyltransferase family protein [Frigoribacterium sp. PvP032]|uniref:acyltransferase family protein n=1 Tax=Frigoribacterium sp. PvP032 TaxID=2806589 RepID=UPI001AE892F1|nr:acyltransferase family protein [Frigoribacterium sp. PvP032]MBP1189607.1 peptidoglycan/LPS O-acetylase OafA/YrhL [Frigoribacterium sp. PvP032]
MQPVPPADPRRPDPRRPARRLAPRPDPSPGGSRPAGGVVRHDVQALRAVAVVAVVLEHVLHVPTGGFVGVDVFFVISGFLITGQLLGEAERPGRIALGAFSRRRVRRLGPSAAVVLVSTVAVGWAVLPPGRFTSLLVDAGWAAGLVSNFRSMQGAGYFDADEPASALQHFWSLAVEEQFYLVWPAVLAVLVLVLTSLGRRDDLRRQVVALLSVVVAASFAWGVVATATTPDEAWFSPLTRAWELAVGAVLAAALPTVPRLPELARRLLGWVGLALIVASAVALTPSTPFPAPGAALPVVGAALVIATSVPGSRTGVARLGLGPGAGLAAASYSLYLWHFPVLVLASAAMPSLDGLALVAVVLGLTAAASTGSYLLVEQPVLLSPWLDGRPATTREPRSERWRRWRRQHAARYRNGGLAVVAAVTLGLLPFALAQRATGPLPPTVVANDADAADAPGSDPDTATPARAARQAEVESALAATTWPTLVPSLDDLLAAGTAFDSTVDPAEKQLLACASYSADKPDRASCTVGAAEPARRAVLVGDSMAGFAFPTWAAVLDGSTTWSLENAARHACPFVDVEVDLGEPIAPCREHVRALQERLLADPPDRLVVSNTYVQARDGSGSDVTPAGWRRGLLALLEPLAAAGTQIVLATPPPSSANVKECYTRTSSPADCVSTPPGAYRKHAAVDAQVSEQVGGVFVATESLWCVDTRCPAFIGTTPTKFDFAHLTLAAAVEVAPAFRELLAAEGLDF